MDQIHIQDSVAGRTTHNKRLKPLDNNHNSSNNSGNEGLILSDCASWADDNDVLAPELASSTRKRSLCQADDNQTEPFPSSADPAALLQMIEEGLEDSGNPDEWSAAPCSAENNHHLKFSTNTGTVATAARKSSVAVSASATRRRKKQKPKCGPQRPLSAYNLFFRDYRVTLMEQDGRSVPFATLGKQVGRKWKSLAPKERLVWEQKAEEDNARYRSELEQYKAAKKSSRNAKRQRQQHELMAASGGAAAEETRQAEEDHLAVSSDSGAAAGMTLVEGEDSKANEPMGSSSHQATGPTTASGSSLEESFTFRTEPFPVTLGDPGALLSGNAGNPGEHSSQFPQSGATELPTFPRGISLPPGLPPSGSQVAWRDPNSGILQTRTICWKVYSLPRSQAHSFLEQFRNRHPFPSSTVADAVRPVPPPPPQQTWNLQPYPPPQPQSPSQPHPQAWNAPPQPPMESVPPDPNWNFAPQDHKQQQQPPSADAYPEEAPPQQAQQPPPAHHYHHQHGWGAQQQQHPQPPQQDEPPSIRTVNTGLTSEGPHHPDPSLAPLWTLGGATPSPPVDSKQPPQPAQQDPQQQGRPFQPVATLTFWS